MVKKRFVLALASALVLAGCAAGAKESSEVTIGLTYVPNIQFAPYYVAVESGYFEEEGIDVKLRHHGQDEDLFGALGQGKEDVVIAGGAEMLQAHTQGVDAVTFQTLYQSYPVAVIVPEDSPIETLEDLAGTTLGIPGRFGETWFGALAFLEQAGLSEAEVQIEEIGFTQQAALAGGHVDAVIGFGNNDVPQFRATGLDVRALPTSPVPVVGIGAGASSTTIAERPEDLSAVARATQRAIEAIIEDPQVALEAAGEHIPGTITEEQSEVMAAVVERTTELYGTPGEGWGVPDLATWEDMNEFMAEMDLIEAPVSLADVVTDGIAGSE